MDDGFSLMRQKFVLLDKLTIITEVVDSFPRNVDSIAQKDILGKLRKKYWKYLEI